MISAWVRRRAQFGHPHHTKPNPIELGAEAVFSMSFSEILSVANTQQLQDKKTPTLFQNQRRFKKKAWHLILTLIFII